MLSIVPQINLLHGRDANTTGLGNIFKQFGEDVTHDSLGLNDGHTMVGCVAFTMPGTNPLSVTMSCSRIAMAESLAPIATFAALTDTGGNNSVRHWRWTTGMRLKELMT